jgi:hypothetical protein
MNTPQTVLDLFAQSKVQWLADARQTARELLKTRDEITIEDVLEVCPKPSYLHRNTVGSVFHSGDFKVVDTAFAKKPSSNKRRICVWGLR